ncbi:MULTISPECIES: cytochrome P450 [unclassified Sphingopyxis]|jgi:cytochrome P450|uniref:cytochrome P450 n=1 Tax=unclassified Sphingopyxis TaxID=2614943 RepID=UPI0007313EAA|nr:MULTISPECIES: cytochrome P450 [unclassified Sphingopyxis]KTE27215.1 cytochrome [Sphingopyxis sp. H057]KTE54520.1 cytochrome [Sphingopyxis sp. H073]KTE56842.1 cytochrome [Sphingopyxis sp. H071]KTE60744.1 cytochrome [Sphingopyxis sp. H107]KTE68037.1 cytochrome [Sphingopyxis sp. H100]
MATQIRPASETVNPLDLSRAELWRNDVWQEPMRQLRAESPIYYCEDSKFGPYWSVTTYKPIQHIEALPKIFSSSWEYGGITVAGDGIDHLQEGDVPMPMFIAMDPPQHTAQRRTVAPAFGPSEIERMRADTQARTAALIDTLPVGKPFDWVEKVSIELTTDMLAILFDFPWEDRHNLTRWSDALGDIESFSTVEERHARLAVAFEMGGAFKQLWDRKAQNPGKHDLISIMLQSDAMKHMSENEFMGNLILLIVGGNDTTRNSMSAYAYGLHCFPEERAKLEANHDPDLAVNAMHEIIRWQTPLAHMRRTATEDTELFGHQIKKRDKLALWYASANRDEEIFPDGDRIIVDRENARRHLAFGYGIHRCVGARVAELQLTTLISEMQKRRLRVNVIGEPERVNACFVHGYRHLQVELEQY